MNNIYKNLIICFGLSFFTLLTSYKEAQACSCMLPSISGSYDYADQVVQVSILGKLWFAPERHDWYLGQIQEIYKGCLLVNNYAIIQTRSSSAACGITLQNKTYLLNAYNESQVISRIPILGVGLCNYNKPWENLSEKDLDFLYSRFNCCEDECLCSDGTKPVNCFVDPCQVSSCDVLDAICISNYCGGCRAEWYDATKAQVCNDN